MVQFCTFACLVPPTNGVLKIKCVSIWFFAISYRSINHPMCHRVPTFLIFSLETCLVFFSFLKILEDIKSFLWGHWYPWSGLLVMFPLGFKARVGSLSLVRCICVKCFLTLTSSATPSNLLMASILAEPISSMYLYWWVQNWATVKCYASSAFAMFFFKKFLLDTAK